MVFKRQAIDVKTNEVYEWLKKNSAELGKVIDEGEKVLGSFNYLIQDIFFALYLESPRLFPISEVSTGARLNRLVLEQMMKSREFKNARKFTVDSLPGAGMVAMYFAETVLSGLPGEITDTANEIEFNEKKLGEALLNKKVAEKIAGVAAQYAGECAPQYIGETVGENVGENAGEIVMKSYKSQAVKWHKVAEEKEKKLRSLAARLNMLWNTSGSKRTAFSGDSDKKGEKTARFETGNQGLGDNKGVWTRGDLSNHLKLVRSYYNSPKLQRLAERVGRFREIREQRLGRSLLEEAAEVRGINYGNDLSMVLPEEWLAYFDPVKKAVFRKKYADETLCLYDLKGKRRKGRGSLIICLDNSGSMQGPKEETSKAIAIALMEIAVSQKRDFVIIMFGGPEDDLRVFEVPLGQCTPEQLAEIGEHFLCSAGTDFEKPLLEAVRYLERDRYPGADIVFITDGVCHVSPDFLVGFKAAKKVRQFRTTVVMVNYGDVSTAPVEAFCDELLLSKDLKGTDVAGRLFGGLRRG